MAYSDAIAELEKKLFGFDPQAQKVYELINDLKAFQPIDKPKSAIGINPIKVIKLVFDKNAPATEQVIFALKYLNKVSKASEIISAIKEFDTGFDKGLSTPFYKLKEIDTIGVYNPTISEENPTGSNHQVYYGLKEWFLQENVVKDEYLTDSLKCNDIL